MRENQEIRFYYITEKNMQEIEKDRNATLIIVAVIGILMLLSV